jgi:hypothetical protein
VNSADGPGEGEVALRKVDAWSAGEKEQDELDDEQSGLAELGVNGVDDVRPDLLV